jgi:3-oxoacyl-[acyl-carrier protein] reductase
MTLQGKTALITGATGGLGHHLTLAFGAAGARVVVHYHTREQTARGLVERLRAEGAEAIAVGADVGVEADVQAMAARAVEAFGGVDILINNAGVSRDAMSWKMDAGVWNEQLAVNLTGAFYCTKAVLPPMRERGWGRIVNMTSIVGQIGVAGAGAYAASKAGIVGFTKAVAREVVRRGITVNCLALGYFREGMLLALPPEVQQGALAQIPLGRFGEPGEVVAAALFLCSEEAAYLTGQTLNLNGGMFM